MADLSIITNVIHWIILIYLCKKPLHFLLIFTAGIYFACLSWLLTDNNYNDVGSEWVLFDYVKRTSLFIAYLGYIWIYYEKRNKYPQIFFQWVLTINVFEAGIFTLSYFEIFPGLLMILLTPFSPQFHLNQDNKTLFAKSGNILQRERFNYFSVKWYFRFYLIVIGTWHITSYYFNDRNASLFTFLTCFIPVILNEYYLDNFLNHFNVRAFALFILTAIDSSFDTLWMNKQPKNMIPTHLNIFLRNGIQVVIILTVFGLCILNDKYREKDKNAESESPQIEKQTNV